MTKLRVGVYPGTFDPITKGHMDIVIRAAALVDKLVVAVVDNTDKGPLFDAAERVAMVEAELQAEFEARDADDRQVEVRAFDNLLTHFARQVEATVIIRGLRAVSDFEYEFQMATMNARLEPDIETVFLSASERQQFVASRLVKEIARLGGDVTEFVSPRVAAALAERFAEQKPEAGRARGLREA
ncbi:MAG: pantetheine-phosphate adenylyltransferase [Proteobacteria bacterium]|nr:pantetheine-phosphate adenylyltransferase [Pseudomonadota bacterium]MCH9012345.1 pantetheine-phosphate adenylyltransferase [Pseudomonadota bacterium]